MSIVIATTVQHIFCWIFNLVLDRHFSLVVQRKPEHNTKKLSISTLSRLSVSKWFKCWCGIRGINIETPFWSVPTKLQLNWFLLFFFREYCKYCRISIFWLSNKTVDRWRSLGLFLFFFAVYYFNAMFLCFMSST